MTDFGASGDHADARARAAMRNPTTSGTGASVPRSGPWAGVQRWCQTCGGMGDHVTEMHPVEPLLVHKTAGVEVRIEAPEIPPLAVSLEPQVDAARAADGLPEGAYRMGSREWVARVMDATFESCRGLRNAGQAEYARRVENAFANFDRVAERLGPPHTPETVLMTYYEKHIDGIHSHIAGNTSQREPVEGRIHDAIVYLVLLKGLIIRRRARAFPDAPRCPACSGMHALDACPRREVGS